MRSDQASGGFRDNSEDLTKPDLDTDRYSIHWCLLSNQTSYKVKQVCLLFFLLSAFIARAQWYPGITAGLQITDLSNKQGPSRWDTGNGFRTRCIHRSPFFKT
ncbi:MAG TPA: hypothetical protein VIT44_01585 [Cyclobacteriaceae bacterium]